MAASGNEPRRADMTPERWQQVKGLLAAVLETDPSERSAYLDRACSTDRFLRDEVVNLLAADHGLAAEFLNPPELHEISLDDSSAKSRIGRRIGPYQLVEEIGEGGMGEVYRAFRADDQYRKQVAIKLVRAGQDSRFVLARFKNERQVLASLDHPNIARLLDGGTTEDGAPYFVMELIEGEPIDTYCESHNLPTTARLKLFLQVGAAVNYAHQHLIIHRDIKPGNILVTAEEVPKLLDFGIAKILDADAASGGFEPTLTVFRVLTPGYASPEQVKGDPITTASDVYSLGVVLYELLTGQHPYRRADVTPQEMARAVCEVDPERPSTAARRTENGDRSKSGPAASGSLAEPREKLSKRLRGDLDNILLMALRKEPGRRYASVEQFNEDIRRHLENLPVIARKDTARYRMTKFVARHKVSVAAAAIVAATLAVGIAVSVHEERVAQRRFDDVRSLANSLIFDVHDAIQDLPGSTPARKLIVAKAVKYLDDLAQQSQSDPSLQRELAAGYRRIGEVDATNLGDAVGALASYKKALAIRQTLLASRHANLEDLVEFAETQRLAAWTSMELDQSRSDVLQTYHQAAQMLEGALASHPNNVDILRELMRNYGAQASLLAGGFGISHLGDVPAAIPPRRKQVELADQLCALQPANADFQRDLAASLGLLGDLFYAIGQEDEASQGYSRSQKILETLAAESPSPKVLMTLYDSYYRAVPMRIVQGDLPGASSNARSALEVATRLSQADPQNRIPKLLLAAANAFVGETMSRTGDRETTNSAFANAMSIDMELVRTHPNSNEFGTMQALRFVGAGSSFGRLGQTDRALHYYEQAVKMFSPIVLKDSANAGLRHYLAVAYGGLGSMLAKSGRLAEAENAHRKALNLTEPETTVDHPDQEALYRTADSYSGLAEDEAILAVKPGQARSEQIEHWKNSRRYYEQSLKVWRQVDKPKILSPEGNDSIPPAVVAQRLEKVNAALRHLGVRDN